MKPLGGYAERAVDAVGLAVFLGVGLGCLCALQQVLP